MSHVLVRGALLDSSIASATGASQQALASNPRRNYLLIQNTGSANIGVNPAGGVAAIGGTGTITLSPGGSYERANGLIPIQAVFIIAGAGQPVTVLEG